MDEGRCGSTRALALPHAACPQLDDHKLAAELYTRAVSARPHWAPHLANLGAFMASVTYTYTMHRCDFICVPMCLDLFVFGGTEFFSCF